MIDACSNGMEQHGAVLPVSQDSFLMQVNGYLMSHSVENFDLSVYGTYLGVDENFAKVAWFYKLG